MILYLFLLHTQSIDNSRDFEAGSTALQIPTAKPWWWEAPSKSPTLTLLITIMWKGYEQSQSWIISL